MKRFDYISYLLVAAASGIAIYMIYNFYIFTTYQSYKSVYGSVSGNYKNNLGDTSPTVGKMPAFSMQGSTIKYEFYILSDHFTGTGVVEGQGLLSRGDEIKVYYDPNNPNISTLDLGFKIGKFVILGLFLGALVFAEHLWFKFRRKFYEPSDYLVVRDDLGHYKKVKKKHR